MQTTQKKRWFEKALLSHHGHTITKPLIFVTDDLPGRHFNCVQFCRSSVLKPILQHNRQFQYYAWKLKVWYTFQTSEYTYVALCPKRDYHILYFCPRVVPAAVLRSTRKPKRGGREGELPGSCTATARAQTTDLTLQKLDWLTQFEHDIVVHN